MPSHPTRKVAAIVERRPFESRWATHRWSLEAVVPDEGGETRTLAEDATLLRRLHTGLELTLFPDEAEGYFLNVDSGVPSVFVSLRIDEASGETYPFQATLSYNEAARWMDSNERVERVVAFPDLALWMDEWVAANYKPEPKKPSRPRSFVGKEGRLRKEGSR
jgi:hypothetical protein